MQTAREREVIVQGVRLRAAEWGDPDAPAILALHGAAGDLHTWDAIAPALAERYHVVAYDCRNHGDSDTSPEPLQPTTMRADALAVANAFGLARFSLLGFALGGGVAIQLAAAFPDRVERLVIEEFGPDIPPEAVAAALLPGAPSLVDWDQIAAIRCPTLLVCGAASGVVPDDTARRILSTIPHSAQTIVPRAGHWVHDDNPAAVLAALGHFFGVPRPATMEVTR